MFSINLEKSSFFMLAPQACSCPPPYPWIPMSAFSSIFDRSCFALLRLHLSSPDFSLPSIIILSGFLYNSSFARSFVRLSWSSWYVCIIICSSCFALSAFASNSSYFWFTCSYFLFMNLAFGVSLFNSSVGVSILVITFIALFTSCVFPFRLNENIFAILPTCVSKSACSTVLISSGSKSGYFVLNSGSRSSGRYQSPTHPATASHMSCCTISWHIFGVGMFKLFFLRELKYITLSLFRSG